MRQKINPNDYHIEFTSRAAYGGLDRRIYFRIKPSELPLLKRLFGNPWHIVKRAYYDEWGELFSIEQFITRIKPLKTIGDMDAYLMEQWNLIKARRGKYFEWPENLNE